MLLARLSALALLTLAVSGPARSEPWQVAGRVVGVHDGDSLIDDGKGSNRSHPFLGFAASPVGARLVAGVPRPSGRVINPLDE